MDIQVSGHQMDVGDALRSRIVNELSEGVAKYFDRGGSAEVRINPDGHGYRVDVSLHLASGRLTSVAAAGRRFITAHHV